MDRDLAPDRWQRINYILELLKQEGDLDALQAFEDLMETVVAWRHVAQWAEHYPDRRELLEELGQRREQLRCIEREAARHWNLLEAVRRIVRECVL